uniref:Reverse transcriptase Ty1/copia-type domain-containing protein n=1 Tax=Vitis vinifera TaxID=29760 RepID=A5BAH4_VITVI|nr:hypothetical protein VITISV_010198 [Vitis vinifera]
MGKLQIENRRQQEEIGEDPKKEESPLTLLNKCKMIAMQEELNQFEKSEVWELVPRPSNQSVIGTRWVFRNKMDENDIIVRNKARLVAQEFSKCMHSEFEMSMMGELNFFLRLQIKQLKEETFINQTKYIRALLKMFNMKEAKTMKTPMSSSIKLDKDEKGKSIDSIMYRDMIGSLLYLTASRPDIMYNICLCARFQFCPKESHLTAVKRILRYLKWTMDIGLWYPKSDNFELIGFSDVDFVGCKVERKITSDTCHFLGHSLVSWHSKKQNSVALSTAEAEYRAVDLCYAQILWMKQTLSDFDLSFEHVPIKCDNTSAIRISKNLVQHSRTKHIEIKHYFLRDHAQKGDITLEFFWTALSSSRMPRVSIVLIFLSTCPFFIVSVFLMAPRRESVASKAQDKRPAKSSQPSQPETHRKASFDTVLLSSMEDYQRQLVALVARLFPLLDKSRSVWTRRASVAFSILLRLDSRTHVLSYGRFLTRVFKDVSVDLGRETNFEVPNAYDSYDEQSMGRMKFEKAPDGSWFRRAERPPTQVRGQGQAHLRVKEEAEIREMEEGIQFEAIFYEPMMSEPTYTVEPYSQPSFNEPPHTEIPPHQEPHTPNRAPWMDLSAQISSLGIRMEELAVVNDTRFYSMEDHMD